MMTKVPNATVTGTLTAIDMLRFRPMTPEEQIADLYAKIRRYRQGIDGNLAKIDQSLAEIERLTASTTSCDKPRDVP